VPAAPCAGEAAPRGREQRIPVNVKVNGCIHRPPPDSSQGRRRRRCEQGAPVHPPLARPRVRYLGIDPRAAGCGRDRTPAASTVDRGAAAPHGKARGERHRWGPHVTQVRVTRGTSHRTLLTRQTCASVGVSLAAQRGAGTALLTKSPRRITKMLLLFACPFTKRWPSASGAVRDARRPPLTRRYLPQPQRHSPAASGDQFANPCPRPGQHVPDSTSMAQVAVAAGVVDRDGANGPSVVTGAGQLPGVRGGCVSVSGNVSFQ
jgi:hypothetical protein